MQEGIDKFLLYFIFIGDIMSFKHSKEKNVEKLDLFLEEAIHSIKTEEDPFELNNLKKVFKKSVPFFMRSYVAVYMLKKLTNVSLREEKTSRSASSREKKAPYKRSREDFDESLYETLFFSVGRKRRVYPKDIVGLLMQNAKLEKTQIGLIRVLDNYSFVQIMKEDAQKVIDLLNGFEFRGRKLTVSFSRKKEEADS